MDEAVSNLIGTLIGTGAGLWNNSEEREFNAEEAQKNRDFQREEREAAQAFNLHMWNETNEYNSLSSQIERARAAGVSPNAIIGKGSGTTGLANPLTTSAANGSQASYSSSLGSTLATNMANLSKIAAETKLLNQQAKNTQEDTRGKQQQNDFFAESYEERMKQIEQATENMELDALLKRQEFRHVEIDIASARLSFQWLGKLNEAEYQAKMLSLNNLRSQFLLDMKNVDLVGEQIDTENAKQADYYASASLKGEQKQGQEYQNTELKHRAKFSEDTGLPLGTAEFEFQYAAHKAGVLQELCDSVISPTTKAKLKPTERYIPMRKYEKGTYKGDGGVNLGKLGKFGGEGGYDYEEETIKTVDGTLINP